MSKKKKPVKYTKAELFQLVDIALKLLADREQLLVDRDRQRLPIDAIHCPRCGCEVVHGLYDYAKGC